VAGGSSGFLTNVTGNSPIVVSTPSAGVRDISFSFTGEAPGDTIFYNGAVPGWDLVAGHSGTIGSVYVLGTGQKPFWAPPTEPLQTNAMAGTFFFGFNVQAPGDLLYNTGVSGPWDNLAIGSTGDVLTVVAGFPSWQAPSGAGIVTNVTG